MAQHAKELKRCPQCGVEKEIERRARFCSAQCANAAKRAVVSVSLDPVEDRIMTLAAKGGSIREVSEAIDRSERSVRETITRLAGRGYSISVRDDDAIVAGQVRPGTAADVIVHSMTDYAGGFKSIGATGDNHLGSKHERLDVLNALYDIYASEGVTEVFNTGNWIEGECRFNFHDIRVFGMDDQLDYWIEHYPQRKGITTYFIAGDDHEGWYQKRERVEIGRYAMLRAQDAGRDDLKYIGYVEADVELKARKGSRMMKVVHPGGGSAYALSYSMQKWIEALQGGEKPSVVLAGHYHKFDHNFYREVHSVQTACTVDQSVFLRKMKIQAHVGGVLLRLNQREDGLINRFMVEFFPFYDRGFYQGTNRRQFTPPQKKKAA